MKNLVPTPLVALALIVVASGCTDAVNNMTDNQTENQTDGIPNPEVVSTQVMDGAIEDIIGQESTVETSVVNNGAGGDITVSIVVMDENGTALYEDQQETYIGTNETQIVEFDIPEVPVGAVSVQSNATAT